MAKFRVPVVRTYCARHLGYVEVEAANEDAAREAAEALLDEDSSHDPDDYENTHESEGYDDCGSWKVEDFGRAVEEVDEEGEAQTMLADQELDTVLAALRSWQKTLDQGAPDDLMELATRGGEHPAQTVEEIDSLCERLNCSPTRRGRG